MMSDCFYPLCSPSEVSMFIDRVCHKREERDPVSLRTEARIILMIMTNVTQTLRRTAAKPLIFIYYMIFFILNTIKFCFENIPAMGSI